MSSKFHAGEDRITARIEPKTKVGRWPYGPMDFGIGGSTWYFNIHRMAMAGNYYGCETSNRLTSFKSGRALRGSLRCYESSPLRFGDNAEYPVIDLTLCRYFESLPLRGNCDRIHPIHTWGPGYGAIWKHINRPIAPRTR